MTAKFPISCEYDQLAYVPEKFGGTKKEAQPEKETPRVRHPKKPYAELRAASAFSFLDGASLPEDLVYAAAQMDVPAMALVDTNGVYGAPRFYGAAKKAGLKALVGAELILELPGSQVAELPSGSSATRQPDHRATLLVENRAGYKNLCKLLTAGAATREKGKARFTWELIEQYAGGLHCLTRDDDATVEKIAGIFKGRTHVELQRHSIREEEHHNQRLIALAKRLKLPLVATNGVRYARDEDKPLHDVLTCIREGRNLDTAGRLLGINRQRHIKGAAEMVALFKDIPQAVSNAWELSQRLDFTLANLGYQFPQYPLPGTARPRASVR